MWKQLRLLAIIGWFFGSIGGLLFDIQIARIVLLVMLLVHAAEVPLGLYFAHRAGYPPINAAIQTFLYGFLFWLPTFILEQNQKGEKH